MVLGLLKNGALSWAPKAIVPIMLAFFGWGLFRYFLPEDKSLDDVRRSMANDVIEEIVPELPHAPETAITLVVPLKNDPSGEVTDLLRENLGRTGVYRPVDRSTLDRILRDLNFSELRTDDLTEARDWGGRAKARFVITGDILELSNLPDRKRCEIAMTVIDMATTAPPFQRSFSSAGSPFVTGLPSHGKGYKGFILASILVLFFVLLLPILSFKLVHIVAAMESNVWNFVMLVGYTLADLLFAFFLMGFEVGTIGLGALWPAWPVADFL